MTDHADSVQKMLFEALTAADICGGRIFDKPGLSATMPYVSFGPADQVDDGAEEIDATTVTQQLDVWSTAQDGFMEAKTVSGAIRSLLNRETFPLDGAFLIEIEVRTIRHLVEGDGTTIHSAIEVRALVESA